MQRNIVLATWQQADTAYRGFGELNHAGIRSIHQLAIVAKNDHGRIKLKDANSKTIAKNTVGGGLIGMVVGILGGPIGMLLGYSMGSLMGKLADMDQIEAEDLVLAAISKTIPRGTSALLVDISEEDTGVLDDFFYQRAATVRRWHYDEVESEVESAVAAYENASHEVKKTIQREKKVERQIQRKQKWDEFKAKFLMQRSD